MAKHRATPPCKGWDDFKPITEDQINALDDQQLAALSRSTNPTGRYSAQFNWAQAEITRRKQAART